MEDAVKALLMAAGILIGLMIISLGVTLFSSLSQYTDSTQTRIEENSVQAFNEQFIKYINCSNEPGADVIFELTIQDVITAANLAAANNKKYGLDTASEDNYYVTINIIGEATSLEKNVDTVSAGLLKEKGIETLYKCTNNDLVISKITGRVYIVNFQEYPAT